MEEYQIIFMRIREWFRKNSQTNWGKNQIISALDDMEKKVEEEKAIDKRAKNGSGKW